MGRGRHAVGVAVVGGMLALGPWPGALMPLLERVEGDVPAPVVTKVSDQAAFGRAAQDPLGRAAYPADPTTQRSACGCEDVVVNATNVVRDASIRSGDAKVENFNLTYISRGYIQKVSGDIDVKIRQRATAQSGDAMAGQTIGVAGSSPRCLNVIVRAVNIVEDTEVRSGDATATNRNIVLLDPGIDGGNLELKVRQRARAESGQASAGQVIGVAAETGGRCGRGSVTIEAVNHNSNVEVRSGDATATNRNSVINCGEVGCAAELARYLRSVDQVLVCTSGGCRQMSAKELAAELGIELAPRPEPPPWLRGAHPRADLGPVPVPDPFGGPAPPDEEPEEDPKPKEKPTPSPDPDPDDDEASDPEGEDEPDDDEEPEATPTPTPEPSPTARSA